MRGIYRNQAQLLKGVQIMTNDLKVDAELLRAEVRQKYKIEQHLMPVDLTADVAVDATALRSGIN